jgi:glycosyltransferase involved in cell wall biosynthesis
MNKQLALKSHAQLSQSIRPLLPNVSVLMSCYNGVKFLSEAIESILAQTFTDFEFILIDDGSTDDTLRIIKDYAAKDKRILVIEKKNTGLTNSLNVGIRAARGKWIARLDQDDVALPTRLQDQISFISKNLKVVLVGTGCIEIDEKGRIVGNHLYPNDRNRLERMFKRAGGTFPHSSAFFRRDKAIAVGGYCERIFTEDLDLWFRLSEIGDIACLPAKLVLIRKHGGRLSSHDQGFSALIFGFAAIVCHILRSKDCFDPSKADEKSWKDFVDWLKIRLEQQNCFDRRLFYSDLKNKWYQLEPQSCWSKGLGFAKLALRHPIYCLQIVRDKFWGSNLPAQLADEWIQSHGVDNELKERIV